MGFNPDDAAALATIAELVDSAAVESLDIYTDAGGEQDIVEDTAETRRRISLEFDLNNMTQNGTIRIYRKVDGTTYRIWIEQAFVAADPAEVFDAMFTTGQAWKLTYEEAADEGSDRVVTFNYITEAIE